MARLTALCVEAEFRWGAEQQRAFDNIKKTLISALVLVHPRCDAPFIVETDASNFALGAVLLQADDQGVERPVSFFSRKMTPAETNYPIYDKELLAIMASLSKWQHYLMYACNCVVLCTDHKALEYHKAPHKMNQHQAWWNLEIS